MNYIQKCYKVKKKLQNHVTVINSFDIKINLSILVLPHGQETLLLRGIQEVESYDCAETTLQFPTACRVILCR